MKTSATGSIKISYPIIYNGIEINNIVLYFKNGKVIEFESSNNLFLSRLLNIDEGASYLGEIGFGTNYNNKNFIGNIIFDEKMGRTLHITLGNSYSKCKNGSFSSIHLDMIIDTTNDVSVYLDSKLFLKNRNYYI